MGSEMCIRDRYSGWPNAEPLKNLDTEAVINILEEWFVDTGKPERIRTDGGPQFRDKFTQWCKAQNIIHELSSAYHHESNGHAEVTVRDMKRLLEKTKNEKEFKKRHNKLFAFGPTVVVVPSRYGPPLN